MGVEEIDIGGPSLHKTEYNLTAALKEWHQVARRPVSSGSK